MNNELLDELKFLYDEVSEIDAKLAQIEQTLGEHGQMMSEVLLTAMVDDTLRLAMMRRDIVKWAAGQVTADFAKHVFKQLAPLIKSAIEKGKSK